jgi:hypothetical protein
MSALSQSSHVSAKSHDCLPPKEEFGAVLKRHAKSKRGLARASKLSAPSKMSASGPKHRKVPCAKRFDEKCDPGPA